MTKRAKPARIRTWWCETHGAWDEHAVGCPDCVTELRAENSKLRAENAKLKDAIEIATASSENMRTHRKKLQVEIAELKKTLESYKLSFVAMDKEAESLRAFVRKVSKSFEMTPDMTAYALGREAKELLEEGQ